MRLLLIEDDPLLRSTLTKDLERAGYAVDGAGDGESGEFLGSTEHYDIAVLDLGLPRLSGLEVLRRWRASGVMVPVIVLTARDEWHERSAGCFCSGSSPTARSPTSSSARWKAGCDTMQTRFWLPSS